MTIDELLKQVDDNVEYQIPLSPSYWIDVAQRLNSLMSQDTDLLHKLQREIAQERIKWIEEGKSVAEAKLRIEATELFEKMKNQLARCERINEAIRNAKIQGKMRMEEFKGGNL